VGIGHQSGFEFSDGRAYSEFRPEVQHAAAERGRFVNKLTVTVICAFVLTIRAEAQERAYTLAQAAEFRSQWNLDNWDDGGPLTRYVFLNMPEFFNHSLILRGGPVRELEVALRPEVAQFITNTEAGRKSLQDYTRESTVDGVLVLHKGKIVFESYPQMRSVDLHLYMSVSKVLTATLIAILEDRGQIDVRKSVDAYLPELAGSGWAGVPVRDVLDMASGIGCLELEEGAYSDPATCYYQFEAALGWMRPSAATVDNSFEFVSGLTSHRPPGEAYEYTSVDTFMLGWLAEAVTGRNYAELLSTEIWQKMGAESTAVIAAPRRGVPVAHGGVSSTLRDLARFGLLFTPTGRAGKDPLVSDRYLENIQQRGRPEVFRAARDDEFRDVDGEPARHNSYQWNFVLNDGDFFKSGFGGQGLYISPSRDLVIVFFGTLDESGKQHELPRVARQLAKSDLFDR
jgi:CubicO group peptidase (beta-lactamase class C family)